MPFYLVKLKHDNGTAKIQTFAKDEETAAALVMAAENCPRRAIQWIKDLTPAKVKQLAAALVEADKAAQAAGTNEDDGGSCNFDRPMIRLFRWSEADIKTLNELTATLRGQGDASPHTIGDAYTSRFWSGYRPVHLTSYGQGMRRTRMAEAAYKSLQAATPPLDIRMYYQAD